MNGWDREYLQNKEDYLKLFESIMSREQETNVDFLENNIKKIVNRKHVVIVNNGTDALHFALMSHNIKPNDEVLVSNFSWISTASCISMVGATPVFCDVNIDTYHMSLESIKKMYSDKTRAIIYPHLFGNMSDTKDIIEFCKEKNIVFIEDACQALGSSLNNIKAGTIGNCSAFSFNANKVIAGIAGGGAFLTDDDSKASMVKKLRRMGKDKDFELLGRNSKMLLFNAEVINYRLQKLNNYKNQRQKIADFYNKSLHQLPIDFQNISKDCDHVYHKYTIRLKDKKTRDFLLDKLKTSIHYDRPISENSMYNNIVYRSDNCKNTKIICDTILSLPNHPWLTIEEQSKISNIIMMSI
jgi:dTDP-4-amino-4,6-dideoxygalactose transaminase